MALGGIFLRFSQTGLRVLEFCCAAIVLGIYSYFLAVLSRHDVAIPTWEKAVAGMSGAAVIYTIFGILLTLFLGGIAVFGFTAVFLDVCFIGCFAAIAWYSRHGANKCTGIVNTPIGVGLSNQRAPGAGTYGYACSLNTAVFAVAILAIFLFLTTAVLQPLLVKHHKKEKAASSFSSNDKGRRVAFWKRNKKTSYVHDAEMATSGSHAH